jgi:predicted nucleic acid-binding protein
VYVYVDTSALVKLLVVEAGTDTARRVWDQADELASSTPSRVELAAALSRAARDGRLTPDQAADRYAVFAEDLSPQMDWVIAGDPVVGLGIELAFNFVLRGYDATHLASAVLAGTDVMLSADAQLLEAAAACGLDVADARADV